jgi:CelD/BcsL family acetyltransferase involved in cellulose biosynthesis
MTAVAPSLPAPPRHADSVPEAHAPDAWSIEIAHDRPSLEAHLSAWERLAQDAAEPNVFYEPWMFLPGLEAFGHGRKPLFVFVYRQPRQLCGFFPLERLRRFKKLPIRALQLWDHQYGFLCTPLLHRDWTRETLHTLLDWIQAEERASVLRLQKVHGDGPFHHALVEVLRERRTVTFTDEVYTRALMQRAKNADAYLSRISSSGRKQWRRLRKRLSEEGTLESRTLEPQDDVEFWIDAFLRVEASGWKGKDGTAMGVNPVDRAYFETIARNAFERGQLHMLGLFLDERPLALQCNFLSGPGGFAFKVAFDEAFAKYSPGIQLELDNIADLHQRTNTQWLDSCVDPGPHVIDRLWHERRVIQSVVLATSRWAGNGVVGLLPLARALKRMWNR